MTHNMFIISLWTVPPEDIDRYRRRFNMKMLVPGRPVKEASTPPPVPAERPSYKETFIPPELSMWDYFVAKVRTVIKYCAITLIITLVEWNSLLVVACMTTLKALNFSWTLCILGTLWPMSICIQFAVKWWILCPCLS